MSTPSSRPRVVRVLAAALASLLALPVFAAGNGVEVSNADHAQLHSLRGVMPRPDDMGKSHVSHPARPLPWLDGPGTPADAAVQGQAVTSTPPIASPGFDGIGQGFSGPQGSFTVDSAPPDTNGAAGTSQYVQTVNTALAVFDKVTGAVQYGPVPINTLFQPLGGRCASDNDGDPVVLFDKLSRRWIISQFAVTTTPYYQCVAVSQTEDATGAYNLYAFNYGTTFPDYPKIGVWPDAYYISFNMFKGNSFVGAKVCAFDRNAMLTGQPATQQCVQLSTSYGGLLPADLDGSNPPPAGAPGIFLARGASVLYRWLMHVDWANPAATKLAAPVSVPVAAYTAACSGGTCVPQQGVTQKLDSLADRLMYRLAYRNFGTYESAVVTHSVQIGNFRKGDPTAVRWYELRNPGGSVPSVYQQGTYNPDTTFRWMGSMAQDKQGNMAMGYSVSSTRIHPGIRIALRSFNDPSGTFQSEQSVIEGTGSQTGQNLTRWGDYSAMSMDPVDDCTFWYTSQFLRGNGAFNWSTRIMSFRHPSCQ